MTRGKMVLIEDKSFNSLGYYVSCEFNGDMYMSWYGKHVVRELETIDNVKDFELYLKYFNDKNFKYDLTYFGTCYNYIVDKTIDLASDYFENWFSDYVYFKNASKEDITIKCLSEYNEKNEQSVIETTIKSGEIKVFNFGTEIDYKKELKELEESEK